MAIAPKYVVVKYTVDRQISAFVSADRVCYFSNDCTKLHSVTVIDITYEIHEVRC
jgi:hypothetical protein